MAVMAANTKAASLKAVAHWWQRSDDEDMKPIAVQLAAREGNTLDEIAQAAGVPTTEITHLVEAATSDELRLASGN